MALRSVLIFILALSVPGCAATAKIGEGQDPDGNTFAVTGSTRFNGEPLSRGEITAFRAEPGGQAYSAPIGGDGSFQFRLPPGPYFLMGRGFDRESKTQLFSFWMNNPIQILGDIPVPIVMPFVTATDTPRTVPGRGIRGRVVMEGEPVEGAVAVVFLDANEAFHGLPYARSLPTSDTGEFILDVEPGRYFILARSRSSGGVYEGPLLKGDLSGFYPHNPVFLKGGEGLELDIPMTPVNRPRGEGSLVPGETMIVEGRVTTVSGEPAPDIRVVLYNIPEMLGRPAFVSSPTDGNGYYRLEVSRSGTFYAAARSVLGRAPQTGELMGFYGGSEDHSVVLRWGDRLTGIDIIVEEVW